MVGGREGGREEGREGGRGMRGVMGVEVEWRDGERDEWKDGKGIDEWMTGGQFSFL